MPTARPPKVSVAIPVYNGEPYLAAAIASVLAQSFTDFELIICDDHSRDASREVAAAYDDSRIRRLANDTNLGFGGNWNRCLSEARGDYIKILPQDDVLHPDCLKRQVGVLDADAPGEIAFTFCARAIIGPTGKTLLRRGLGPKSLRLTGPALARRTARLGTNPIGEPGAVLFRRKAAAAAGAFDGIRPFVIDIDYWLRLLKQGDAVYLPDVLASFRVSAGSQSVMLARRQAADFTTYIQGVARSGLYPLSRADLRIGALRARLNGFARALFYRLAMRTAQ